MSTVLYSRAPELVPLVCPNLWTPSLTAPCFPLSCLVLNFIGRDACSLKAAEFEKKMVNIAVMEVCYFVTWLEPIVHSLKNFPNVFVIFFFLRFYLFIFRERRKEGEREGEKHGSVASCMPLTEDLARNPGMCPDWEWNCRAFCSQATPARAVFSIVISVHLSV